MERITDVRTRLTGAYDRDGLTDELAQRWRDAGDAVKVLLDWVGNGRDEDQAVSTVVCHGDPHLGNVLRTETGVWLIDWDDALLAPVERDLMFVLGGPLAFTSLTTEQERAFLDGYGPVEPDRRRLAYYRGVRVLDDLSLFAVRVLDRERWSESERRDALRWARGNLAEAGALTAPGLLP